MFKIDDGFVCWLMRIDEVAGGIVGRWNESCNLEVFKLHNILQVFTMESCGRKVPMRDR